MSAYISRSGHIFMLYFKADQCIRNKHWNDLIDKYYNGLSKNCSVNETPKEDWINNEVNGFLSLVWYNLYHNVSIFVISKEKDPITGKKK